MLPYERAASSTGAPGAGPVLGRIAAAVMLALAVAGVVSLTETMLPVATWGTVGAVVAALVVVQGVARRFGTRVFAVLAVLAVVAFTALRLPLVVASPTVPVSDFSFYDTLARRLASGAAPDVSWPNMGVIAAWAYSLVLALAYAVFGAEPVVVPALNLALGIASLLVLVVLAGRVGGPVAACVAATLFVLWPSQILFLGMPATEHLGVLLVLLAAWTVAVGLESTDDDRLPWFAVAGALLAACFVTRSVAGAVGVAALAVILLDRAAAPRRRVLRAAVVVLAFVIGVTAYRIALERTIGVAPVSGVWWSVYVGTNVATDGTWNVADAAAYAAQPDPDSAKRWARDATIARVAADPVGTAALMLRKIAILWADGSHGVWWSLTEIRPGALARKLWSTREALIAIAQAFHVVVLVLGALGLLRAFARGGARSDALLLATIVLITTLAHAVVETQSRYNYLLTPLLFVFAGVALAPRTRDAVQRVSARSRPPAVADPASPPPCAARAPGS